MPKLDPQKQRQFAVQVVRELRDAGFEAYWAGGCVRDQLAGGTPKDYDVATAATPEQVRTVFRRRRTLAIGASFGVIAVLGPRGAGQVEVTTFRQDAAYSDGRHPDQVTFSGAGEDALRRDFTINGLFYDPLADRVIDFVGGEEDLRRRLVRTIGPPDDRFAEDKLRMLRAVRFTAAFEFTLDPATEAAIGRMRHQIAVVSAERIAAEMRRMLVDPHRAEAVRLLVRTGLAEVVLPEIAAAEQSGPREEALRVLERLQEPEFPTALAALVGRCTDAAGAEAVGRRWRLSNQEIDATTWLVAHRGALRGARLKKWSEVQPVLAAPGATALVSLEEAAAEAGLADREDAAWARAQLARPRLDLDPPPLVTGGDLLALGVHPGPALGSLLARLREAQLDGRVAGKAEALDWARRQSE